MTLRDEIARVIDDWLNAPEAGQEITSEEYVRDGLELADRVLALPAIAKALEYAQPVGRKFLTDWAADCLPGAPPPAPESTAGDTK